MKDKTLYNKDLFNILQIVDDYQHNREYSNSSEVRLEAYKFIKALSNITTDLFKHKRTGYQAYKEINYK